MSPSLIHWTLSGWSLGSSLLCTNLMAPRFSLYNRTVMGRGGGGGGGGWGGLCFKDHVTSSGYEREMDTNDFKQ